MIGTLNPYQREVTIIGAGFAGLIAAYALLKCGWRVTLLEKSERCGGMIGTKQTEFGLVERAAHSFRSSPALLRLCDDLDVPLVQARTKKKYILRNGKLRRFPLFPGETAVLIKKAISRRGALGRNLAQWGHDHLGFAAVDYLLTPLAYGIYAASPEELDQEIAFPALTVKPGKTFLQTLWERKNKGNKPKVMTPLHGMQSLVDALAHFITVHPEANIHYGTDITDLPASPNIIIATETSETARFLAMRDAKASCLLEKIRYVPLIAATLFYEQNAVPPIEGIGVLYAAQESRNSLGILFNSGSFVGRVTQDRFASFTMMLSGTKQPELLELGNEELRTLIAKEMEAVLGIVAPPLSIYLAHWPKALPLYNVELRECLESLQERMKAQQGLILFGNYTGQISLRGMTDYVFAEWIENPLINSTMQT